MKHKTLFLMAFAVAVFTAGCNKPAAISEQLDNVQKKTAKARQDMKDYTFAQKAEFTAKMRAQLAEINKELDELAAKIKRSSDAVQAKARPKLQALREQAARLNSQLDESRDATESTWDSVKATSKTAYNGLKDGFNQARQWVSDKIAP